MKTIKYAGLMLVVLAAFTGCAISNYGKINRQTDTQNQIGIEELGDNWEDFEVYYASRDGSRPAALMFDPKNDGRKLVGKSWRKISDPVTLATSVRVIQLWYRDPTVAVIQSPDSRVFGYMYYQPYLNILVRMMDENTLYVDSLPPPESVR